MQADSEETSLRISYSPFGESAITEVSIPAEGNVMVFIKLPSHFSILTITSLVICLPRTTSIFNILFAGTDRLQSKNYACTYTLLMKDIIYPSTYLLMKSVSNPHERVGTFFRVITPPLFIGMGHNVTLFLLKLAVANSPSWLNTAKCCDIFCRMKHHTCISGTYNTQTAFVNTFRLSFSSISTTMILLQWSFLVSTICTTELPISR